MKYNMCTFILMGFAHLSFGDAKFGPGIYIGTHEKLVIQWHHLSTQEGTIVNDMKLNSTTYRPSGRFFTKISVCASDLNWIGDKHYDSYYDAVAEANPLLHSRGLITPDNILKDPENQWNRNCRVISILDPNKNFPERTYSDLDLTSTISGASLSHIADELNQNMHDHVVFSVMFELYRKTSIALDLLSFDFGPQYIARRFVILPQPGAPDFPHEITFMPNGDDNIIARDLHHSDKTPVQINYTLEIKH